MIKIRPQISTTTSITVSAILAMSGWFVVKSNLPFIASLILPCYEPDSSQISRGSSSPSDEGSPKRPLLKFQNTAQRGFIAPSIVISLLLLQCTAIWVAVNQELPRPNCFARGQGLLSVEVPLEISIKIYVC